MPGPPVPKQVFLRADGSIDMPRTLLTERERIATMPSKRPATAALPAPDAAPGSSAAPAKARAGRRPSPASTVRGPGVAPKNRRPATPASPAELPQGEIKPADCTCNWPQERVRNGVGHPKSCPVWARHPLGGLRTRDQEAQATAELPAAAAEIAKATPPASAAPARPTLDAAELAQLTELITAKQAAAIEALPPAHPAPAAPALADDLALRELLKQQQPGPRLTPPDKLAFVAGPAPELTIAQPGTANPTIAAQPRYCVWIALLVDRPYPPRREPGPAGEPASNTITPLGASTDLDAARQFALRAFTERNLRPSGNGWSVSLDGKNWSMNADELRDRGVAVMVLGVELRLPGPPVRPNPPREPREPWIDPDQPIGPRPRRPGELPNPGPWHPGRPGQRPGDIRWDTPYQPSRTDQPFPGYGTRYVVTSEQPHAQPHAQPPQQQRPTPQRPPVPNLWGEEFSAELRRDSQAILAERAAQAPPLFELPGPPPPGADFNDWPEPSPQASAPPAVPAALRNPTAPVNGQKLIQPSVADAELDRWYQAYVQDLQQNGGMDAAPLPAGTSYLHIVPIAASASQWLRDRQRDSQGRVLPDPRLDGPETAEAVARVRAGEFDNRRIDDLDPEADLITEAEQFELRARNALRAVNAYELARNRAIESRARQNTRGDAYGTGVRAGNTPAQGDAERGLA